MRDLGHHVLHAHISVHFDVLLLGILSVSVGGSGQRVGRLRGNTSPTRGLRDRRFGAATILHFFAFCSRIVGAMLVVDLWVPVKPALYE